MEPWSSRYLTRRSRTTLGEMSDVTRRRNSQEVSRLEVAVKHMDRELHVKSSELTHEQLLLQRSLTARQATARRQSLTNSAAHMDTLKRREKDNMQALDGRCKNFMGGGAGEVRGVHLGREEAGDNGAAGEYQEDEDQASDRANGQNRRHRIPSVHTVETAASVERDQNGRSSESPSTDGELPVSSRSGTTATTSYTRGAVGQMTPRQRRYGVAHATDVHLDIDPAEQENKNGGYSPMRRTTMQQYKVRRTSNGNSSHQGNLSAMQQQQQQQQYHAKTAGRTKRESLDLSISTRGQQPGEGGHHTGASTPDDTTHVSTEEGIPQIVQQRKKTLPVVMGRQMRRHDRASKSRESLLLPNLGQGRSPSPISDLRVKVTYADGEEFSSVSDIPFKPHIIRSQRSLLSDSSSGHISPSARGPRLEIDLSIPMATPASNPSSPRPSGRSSKREKTYTV